MVLDNLTSLHVCSLSSLHVPPATPPGNIHSPEPPTLPQIYLPQISPHRAPDNSIASFKISPAPKPLQGALMQHTWPPEPSDPFSCPSIFFYRRTTYRLTPEFTVYVTGALLVSSSRARSRLYLSLYFLNSQWVKHTEGMREYI